MQHDLWIIDQRHLDQSDYELVTCVEGRKSLYVIADGPSPRDSSPDDRMDWSIKADSVEPLTLRGFGSSGNKHEDLVIAKSELPPAETKNLEVLLTIGGVTKIHVTLTRRPAE